MRSEEDIRFMLAAIVAGENYGAAETRRANKVAQNMLTFVLGEPSGADILFVAYKLKKESEDAKESVNQTHLSE